MTKDKIEAFNNGNLDTGWLMPVDFSILPFVPKRIFAVSDVRTYYIERGMHAHRETKQYLICLRGRLIVTYQDNPEDNEQVVFLEKYEGILIDNMVWAKQQYDYDTILLVLASTEYDRRDYIEDHTLWAEEWKSISR